MTRKPGERLMATLEKLPEERLEELLDFTESFLVGERNKKKEKEGKSELNPEKDPILKFIGGVSHGYLAKNIDKALYGEEA